MTLNGKYHTRSHFIKNHWVILANDKMVFEWDIFLPRRRAGERARERE